MDKKNLLSLLRMWPWLVVALVMASIIGYHHPQQIGALVWALCKTSFGAWLGYRIDVSVFYYARPGDINVSHPNMPTAILIAACMIRRAAIMVGVIIGLGLTI